MKFLYCLILGIFLFGCNESVESNLDSNNLDSKSYAGLEDVFLNTSEIKGDGKFVLIIFGLNSCKYCEKLKDDLKEFDELREFIKTNFNAYYVNLSYNKMHELTKNKETIKLNTQNLASLYKISPTPTLVFLTQNGEFITSIPSYLPPKKFEDVLNFIIKGSWKNKTQTQIQAMIQQTLMGS